MDDDFEDQFGDDLDALKDLEDDFEPSTTSRRSLNFQSPRQPPVNNTGNLNDSIYLPLESPKTINASSKIQNASRKRARQEIFGELSDSEEENNVVEELPVIVHNRKKPRTGPNILTVNDDDNFEITPPPSPAKKQPIRRSHLKSFTTVEDDEARLQTGHVSERQKIVKRVPLSGDFVAVTSADGERVYMSVKGDTSFSREISAISHDSRSLQLLGRPLQELREQAEEERQKRLLAESNQINENIKRVTNMDDVTEVDDSGPDPALWVERYAPKSYTELLSDEGTNRLLLHWLKLWDYVVFGKERKKKVVPQKDKKKEVPKFKKWGQPEVEEELDKYNRPTQLVALLGGAPGLGKTTLAHIIARHAGYNVVEINASDDRSADVFKTKIEAATQMKAVLGQDPRPNCLVIDEIDGAPQPAINMLLSLIKRTDVPVGKKKRKEGGLLLRPIICICNDLYVPALRLLKQTALVINFPPTLPSKLASRLSEITQGESLRTDMSTLLALCEKSDNDMRACINTLQFIRRRAQQLTLDLVHSVSVGQKDVQKSLFSIWQQIFSMPRAKQKRYINPYDRTSATVEDMGALLSQNATSLNSRFHSMLQSAQAAGEYEKVMQGLYENYLEAKVKDVRMDGLNLATEWLCFVDCLSQQLSVSQNYSLARYTPFLTVLFHFLFASTQHLKISYPHTQYEVKTKITKCENLVVAMIKDVAPSVRKNINQTLAVTEVLPLLLDIVQPTLRPVNTQLYSKKEKEEMSNLIKTMIAYNITYRQERTPEGQYVYLLDPSLDQVAYFPDLKPHRTLTYAAKQLIAREIELERMRRSDVTLREKDITQVTSGGKQKNRTGQTLVPNHKVKLEAKVFRSIQREKPMVDFFGRVIKNKPSEPDGKEASNSTKSKSVIRGEVWFRFKEGYSNAVRRVVRVQDLM